MSAEILPLRWPGADARTLALWREVRAEAHRCAVEGMKEAAELDDAFGRFLRSCGPVSVREVRLWP